MSLPLPWVDRIFDKLTLVYGRDFAGRWDGLSLDVVKFDWAHELSGFENYPESIKHALQILPPSKPPTVLEFRNLANSCPKMALKELPLPPVDPKIIEMVTQGMKPATHQPYGYKQWAHTLKARHQAGEKLNQYQIKCYRMALEPL
jgi:hypothetical protein